ncbi:helix-turn-helix transcriptional regulator [Catenisphaera adipataccumulans]|jgi:hypothetical protein|uniref:HTH cro/C1-type domain-containing protein n=1 Tax=Catenisphaera adipataccumulans TaxID=700500 RepID=A0A7W8FX90_9FIRM|nr:helix-turn-helix transcriptional regulator [Catenisphaera adipataccumulans]MBB5183460.1 hypothetical protein [Catenisphaera adipataccumulans]
MSNTYLTNEELTAMIPDPAARIKVIRWFMNTKKITIEQISEASGLHYQTIVNVLQRKRKGTAQTWDKIMAVLQLGYVERCMIEHDRIVERLNADIKKQGPSVPVSVLCQPYGAFLYACDYRLDGTFDQQGMILHMDLQEAKQLFELEHPLPVSQ